MATVAQLAQHWHAASAAGVLAGLAGLLYTATVVTVALSGVFAHTPKRRRAAQRILALLLRRPT